jgi:hypothetical protein
MLVLNTHIVVGDIVLLDTGDKVMRVMMIVGNVLEEGRHVSTLNN